MTKFLALLLPILIPLGLATGGQPQPQYEVFAIRFATSPNFRLAGLVEGADPSARVDIAMMVWLVRGNGRNILVDSGFHRDRFARGFPMKDFVKPSEAVAKVGLKPEDV